MTSTAPPPPADKPKEHELTARWWEQYDVRYFVGTVIGGLIVFVLRDHAFLCAEFRSFGQALPESVWKEVTILGAGGLAFCYISSVPMLTLHAVRGTTSLESRWIVRLIWCLCIGLPISVLVAPFVFRGTEQYPEGHATWARISPLGRYRHPSASSSVAWSHSAL